jgi:hypothetical protein
MGGCLGRKPRRERKLQKTEVETLSQHGTEENYGVE